MLFMSEARTPDARAHEGGGAARPTFLAGASLNLPPADGKRKQNINHEKHEQEGTA